MSLSIIPQPVSVEERDGSYALHSGQSITARGAASAALPAVQGLLAEAGIALEAADDGGALILEENTALHDEGYQLSVDENGLRLAARSAAGLFYGAQTIRQLLPVDCAGTALLPCAQIEDAPRFAWRGMHLDVCRHFFSLDFVKRYLDWMAQHKYNVFHWHLTEDQGWRLAVDKYPKLQEVSAWRTGEDGSQYGGFYTPSDVREVVEYARKRHIRVVPEIELPGHAQAALAAYPEYSCTGGPFEVVTEWGVFDEVFCAGNDATFRFLEDVFEEVLALFPDDYVHIGGDECPKTRWKACPRCQQRMRGEGLQSEEELQSYFVRHFAAWLAARGKKPIGWDEILEGGLAKEAAVMSWRGEQGGLVAASAGHDVVMAPESHVYFDRRHYDREDERGRLSVNTLENVYSYEPIPADLDADRVHHILGVEGTMWTEGTPQPEDIAYMLFPRFVALAEVAWSPKEARDWNSFRERLREHGARLTAAGIGYYPDVGVWS